MIYSVNPWGSPSRKDIKDPHHLPVFRVKLIVVWGGEKEKQEEIKFSSAINAKK